MLAHTQLKEFWLAQELLHLDLSGTAVGDGDLVALQMLPQLHTLLVNDQPALDDISDAGLQNLARLPTLRCLEFKGNARITAAGAAPHACMLAVTAPELCRPLYFLLF